MEKGGTIIKVIDLFCGCGGMSLGFQNAGFEISAGLEYWEDAVACYSKNFSHPAEHADISNLDNTVSTIKHYGCDIIIGGPPCQDFSGAGKRNEGDRANLTIAFAKVIQRLKPRFFVMENVARASKSNAYNKAKSMFIETGYGLTEKVLDACLCGVPQKRKRYFCIGEMGGANNFLDGLLSTNQSVFPLTIREFFRNNNYELSIENYYRHPRSYKRRAIFSVDEPSPTIRGVNRPRPENYKAHSGDAILPEGIRCLSYKERALIQTFPDTFNWESLSMVSIEQMIGNAVPVKLAEYVADCLMRYINGDTDLNNLRFIDWLTTKKALSTAVASDTLSRIGRAKRILPLGESYENYIGQLVATPHYGRIVPSVQAQIKRAIKLYYEYMGSIKENTDE